MMANAARTLWMEVNFLYASRKHQRPVAIIFAAPIKYFTKTTRPA
jgi:hypothetical protein